MNLVDGDEPRDEEDRAMAMEFNPADEVSGAESVEDVARCECGEPLAIVRAHGMCDGCVADARNEAADLLDAAARYQDACAEVRRMGLRHSCDRAPAYRPPVCHACEATYELTKEVA